MINKCYSTAMKSFSMHGQGLSLGTIVLLSSSLKIPAGCRKGLGSVQDVAKICSTTYATSADLSFHVVIILHTKTNDNFRAVNLLN